MDRKGMQMDLIIELFKELIFDYWIHLSIMTNVIFLALEIDRFLMNNK